MTKARFITDGAGKIALAVVGSAKVGGHTNGGLCRNLSFMSLRVRCREVS